MYQRTERSERNVTVWVIISDSAILKKKKLFRFHVEKLIVSGYRLLKKREKWFSLKLVNHEKMILSKYLI